MIDSSVLRSGRLECHIGFNIPTPNERQSIIEALLNNISFPSEQEKKGVVEWLINKTSFKNYAIVKGLVERIIIKYVTEKLDHLTKQYLIDHFLIVC